MRNVAIAAVLLGLTVGWTTHKSQGNVNSSIPEISDWRAKNWGLLNREARSHIFANLAWEELNNRRHPVVAVVDTGLDAGHKSLSSYVWHGPDHNYGWNFVTDKANPADDHGHGTHVAGIILAVANFHAEILPVKYYSDANPGKVNLRNTVAALNYAIDNGARIINYSGGGPEFAEDEYLALKRAEANGILVVTAAGNEHQNTDLKENRYFPAAYRLKNMISVASTDIHNNLLASSNWGEKYVDVAAPGESIFSTLPGGRYGYMSGTSQATAFVSGIAALMLSENPKLKAQDLKALIEKSVDRFPQLAGKIKTAGRVNALSAIRAAKKFTKKAG